MWTDRNGGWETCVMVFFACSLVKYENNNKPSSMLELEKKTVLNKTTLVGIWQVCVNLW